MFTADDLTRLAKACGANPAALVVAGIVENQDWLAEGGINTPARVAGFLAQACLETDYFKTLREYWGPTAAQKGYEGRKDLGNVVAGDGKKFMGRGIFQLTGRANYAAFGKRLGIDLLKEPELASQPDISVRIAVMYWNDKGLNAYADQGETAAISRAINRGSAAAKNPANHEADRIKIAKLARQIIKAAPAITVTSPQPIAVEDLPKAPYPTPIDSPPATITSDEPIPKGFWARFVAAFRKRTSA